MSRKILAASVIVAAGFAAPAQASLHTSCGSHAVRQAYRVNYRAVRHLHGRDAPGRQILWHGLTGGRRSSCGDLRRSTAVLRRMRMPRPAAALVTTGRPYVPPAGTETIQGGNTLQAIARCESGGDPGAVDASGTYRGLLQFDQQTWESVGGSGDPAAASAAEQYKRGAMLYAQRGPAAWPVCGQ